MRNLRDSQNLNALRADRNEMAKGLKSMRESNRRGESFYYVITPTLHKWRKRIVRILICIFTARVSFSSVQTHSKRWRIYHNRLHYLPIISLGNRRWNEAVMKVRQPVAEIFAALITAPIIRPPDHKQRGMNKIERMKMSHYANLLMTVITLTEST